MVATVESRDELKEYCLRRLGGGIHTVNVTDLQIEDRIDDAVQYMQTFLHDGTARQYFKYQITQADLDRWDSLKDANGKFRESPWIELPDWCGEVIRIFPIRSSFTRSIFSVKYQIFLNDIYNLRSGLGYDTLTNYVMARQSLEFLDNIINGEIPIRFHRHTNRIYIDEEGWADPDQLGQYLVFDVFAVINPEEHEKFYNDIFLKKYTTALIKLQWGQNLMKYSGVQLPGGVELNGESIYSEAKEEITEIEEQARLTWEYPVDFLTG